MLSRLHRRREFKRTRIEIIPMIDTMFFLLVFFILASLQVIDLKGTAVELPDARNQDQQAPARLTLTIQKDGRVSINKKSPLREGQDVGAALIEELKQTHVGTEVMKPEEAIVVVNADKWAKYSLVRECVDSARAKRFQKFSIATDPSPVRQ
jgi:biopolymer transport protein ExbD